MCIYIYIYKVNTFLTISSLHAYFFVSKFLDMSIVFISYKKIQHIFIEDLGILEHFEPKKLYKKKRQISEEFHKTSLIFQINS